MIRSLDRAACSGLPPIGNPDIVACLPDSVVLEIANSMESHLPGFLTQAPRSLSEKSSGRALCNEGGARCPSGASDSGTDSLAANCIRVIRRNNCDGWAWSRRQ